MFGVGVGYCSVDSVCLGLYLLIWLDDFGCGLLARSGWVLLAVWMVVC